jgi:Spy/CpxP family protein refolding chaperone
MFRGIAVAVTVLALGAGAAVAQNPPQAPPPGQGGPGGGPAAFAARRMQALLQGITVTPAQQARIDSIVTAFSAQMPAFTPGQMPDSASRARRRELTVRQDSTVRAVLTPEQQQVWDRNAANMPQRRPGGGGPGA